MTNTQTMTRPRPLAAFGGAVAALVLAAVLNAVIALLAGERLVVEGELGLAQIVGFTLAMAVPAAIVLWAMPRWFPAIAIAFAILTVPVPIGEFGRSIGIWLGVQHIVAGVTAAMVAPRVAAALDRRTSANTAH